MLLFSFYGYAEEPESALVRFHKLYRNKQFQEAAKLISTSVMGDMETKITINALENMWKVFYDRDTKLNNTKEILQMNKEELAGLKLDIADMKAEGSTKEELMDAESQLKKMNKDIRLLDALVDVNVEISGPLINKMIVDNFAVVVTRVRLNYPQKFYYEIKDYVNDMRLLIPSTANKFIVLGKNSLTFPAIFYLIKTSSGWKVMLFSRDSFPAERFEDFMADYDFSFGELEWMSGSQAQVFWDEASSEMFNRK